ncbi:AcvB/VirJ family lysyl-phosphatidylglycerol hydrolase [Sphingomonas paucimobilis]|uniref:AcvB/VirJ family lysyl-phosphatidylglycerol hydrolase n=1 Tax=Sphingomonas paucimobilis TaxID=13689 RepID=UPI0028D6B51E|nr:AcvB/VirJ family lysyl-phosphatidylglycerol hydrolase [Sphingomonas paucimobilis]
MAALLSHLHRQRRRILAGLIGMLILAPVIILYSGNYFARDPIVRFPAQGRPAPILVLSFSGDMGLRYGMGGVIARALSASGIAVTGINSPVLFRTKRTQAEIDAIVADFVRRAAMEAGDRRLVLLGQSYGADVLQTGLAHLPESLRARVSGIVLVVPGETVFFRSDPSGLAYMGKPDSLGITTARTIDWAPFTCIYGMKEKDSLCPLLKGGPAHIIGLPGGHYLDHDDAALVSRVEAAVRAAPSPVAHTR